MLSTTITIVGNVVADPVTRTTASGSVLMTFRVASNAKRMTTGTLPAEEETVFMNVSCWQALAVNGAQSIRKGMPVVVHGELRSRTVRRTLEDGTVAARTYTDLHAIAMGPNLVRGVTKFWPKPTDAVRRAEEEVLRSVAPPQADLEAA